MTHTALVSVDHHTTRRAALYSKRKEILRSDEKEKTDGETEQLTRAAQPPGIPKEHGILDPMVWSRLVVTWSFYHSKYDHQAQENRREDDSKCTIPDAKSQLPRHYGKPIHPPCHVEMSFVSSRNRVCMLDHRPWLDGSPTRDPVPVPYTVYLRKLISESVFKKSSPCSYCISERNQDEATLCNTTSWWARCLGHVYSYLMFHQRCSYFLISNY